jgi:phenylacetate-CoA ligase
MDLNAVFIKNVLFPMMETFKGNRIRKNLTELQNSQRLSYEAMRSLREEKLKKLLLHCIDNVSAYSRYKNMRQIISDNPFKALTSFPVLTKDKFRTMNEAYISTTAHKKELIANISGGSTGEPVKFYLDRYTVEYYEAARWRGLSWHDIKIGDRSVMIWGSPIELSANKTKKYQLKEKFLKNRIMLPAYDLNPGSIKGYIEKINSYKPLYIYGYASSLALFSKLALRAGLSLDFIPKAIISTSETLYDFQREEIKKMFKCNVVNEYGARDGGILAYECPKGKMHIAAENVIIEIVDPVTKEILPAGKSGLILVTDLNNFSMPRLRYQLGDMGALSPDSLCDCGVILPVLERIEGREDDTFVSQSGSYVHGHYFNHIVRNMESFKQFQIIQKTPSDILLKIIKSSEFKQSDLDIFIEGIKKGLGDVNIKLEFVESIPASPSGKVRYAIREFPLE